MTNYRIDFPQKCTILYFVKHEAQFCNVCDGYNPQARLNLSDTSDRDLSEFIAGAIDRRKERIRAEVEAMDWPDVIE